MTKLSKRYSALLVAGALLQLTACSTPTPALFTNTLSIFGSSSQKTPQTSAKWWQTLGDPVLDNLVEQALSGNFTIKAAAARLDEAGSSETHDWLSLAPQAGADVKASKNTTKSYRSNNPYSAPSRAELPLTTGSFQVSWELPLFGKAEAALAHGKAQATQSYWQLEAAKVSVASEVVRTYAEWQGVQRSLDLTKNSENLSELLEDSEQVLVKEGVSANQDVDRLHSQTLSLKTRISDLENRRAQLEHRLAALLGTPATPYLRTESRSMSRPPAITEVKAETLRWRPDVQAAEQSVALAAAQYGMARADLWPQLTLGGAITGTHGTLDSTGYTLGTSGATSYSAGLHLPLLDWFSLKAASNMRLKEMNAVVEDYHQTVLTAWEEAQNAYADYQTAVDKEALATQQTDLASHDVTNQKALASAGVGTLQDVLKARIAANDKQAEALSTRFSAIESWAKLTKATFVSFEPVKEPKPALINKSLTPTSRR